MAKFLDETGLAKLVSLIKGYAVPLTGGTITGDLTVEGKTTVQAPTEDTDAATKAYVDEAVASATEGDYLPLTGGTLTGPLSIDSTLTVGGAIPTISRSFFQVGTQTINILAEPDASITFRGNLRAYNAGGNTGEATADLTGFTYVSVPTPTEDTHAATKAYVDAAVSPRILTAEPTADDLEEGEVAFVVED